MEGNNLPLHSKLGGALLLSMDLMLSRSHRQTVSSMN